MSKNSYVVNPSTSRPIKVGSRAYLKLVKLGVFDPDQEVEQTTPIEEGVVEEAKVSKKKTYAKKIEERKKVKSKSIPVPVQSESESESDYDQLEREIERMIMDELRTHKKAKADKPKKVKKVVEKVPPKTRGRPKKVIEEVEEVEEEEEEEFEVEEESETDEETDEDSD